MGQLAWQGARTEAVFSTKAAQRTHLRVWAASNVRCWAAVKGVCKFHLVHGVIPDGGNFLTLCLWHRSHLVCRKR